MTMMFRPLHPHLVWLLRPTQIWNRSDVCHRGLLPPPCESRDLVPETPVHSRHSPLSHHAWFSIGIKGVKFNGMYLIAVYWPEPACICVRLGLLAAVFLTTAMHGALVAFGLAKLSPTLFWHQSRRRSARASAIPLLVCLRGQNLEPLTELN